MVAADAFAKTEATRIGFRLGLLTWPWNFLSRNGTVKLHFSREKHSRRTTARLDTLFRRNDDTRMEALMDLADWLRSLGLERYKAAHIETVSRKPKRKYA